MTRIIAIAAILALTACGPYTQADYDASAALMVLGTGLQNAGHAYATPTYYQPRLTAFCYPVGGFVSCY
jgi:hypothetical protein